MDISRRKGTCSGSPIGQSEDEVELRILTVKDFQLSSEINFLWVQACQDGSLNRQLHCGANQQKLAELLVSELFSGGAEEASSCVCVIAIPADSQLIFDLCQIFILVLFIFTFSCLFMKMLLY